MTAIWAKSSLSFSNGNCVEVAELPVGFVGVRDGRDPEGPVLRFTQGEWNAFRGARLRGIRPDGVPVRLLARGHQRPAAVRC